MKTKSFMFISIIIISLISGIPTGILQFYSNPSIQNTPSLTPDIFDMWKDVILDLDNMEPEDFLNLPPKSICSIYEQITNNLNWLVGFYSKEEKNGLLDSDMDTPSVRYLGPDNLPIEGYDLKSYDDEKFEINFRIDDNIANEWIVRVYAYIDYGISDTILSESDKFEDGSDYKQFQLGEEPSFEELNPDESFMGIEFDKILEDFEEWTTSEKDYTAKKEYPGRIDQEIYFHVKVLYKTVDGLQSYYYKNFYIPGYWTSNLEYRTLNIKDDDIVAPVISNVSILNPPIYDGYENITFEITAEDDSGIESLYIKFLGNDYLDDDKDFQITIPNPSLLGEYSFNVIAIDGDNDRDNDQLSTTLYSSFEILDDDDNTPICTDICIINTPIYDAYDYVIFEFNAEDPSGIAELYIDFMETKYYLDENNQILVPNPRIPGEYGFSAVAIDADLDYQGDQLNTTINSYFEVLDDDVTPPQIFVSENECEWSISIIDNDGFIDSIASGNYSLFDQDGNILTAGVIAEEGTIYYISKEQINLLKPGTFTLKIYSTNNDVEWQGDEETSTLTLEKSITLEDCYNYVIAQIEELKIYIEDNLYCFFTYLADCYLDAAIKSIQGAYNLLMQGQECWLTHLNTAISNLNDFESIVQYFTNNKYLPQDIGEYILQSINDIKVNINLLIEYSTDYSST